jgi:hypothetical protein
MRVGILSDTHGHVGRTAAAARLLLGRGVKIIIHCGDIGSEGVLAELAAAFGPASIPVYAVPGNVDHWDLSVKKFPVATGVHVLGRIGEVDLDGHPAAIIHGDDGQALSDAIAGGRYDYLFTGHTHVSEDTRNGRTRIINPGAIYRAHTPSVAILDTATGSLETLPVQSPA